MAFLHSKELYFVKCIFKWHILIMVFSQLFHIASFLSGVYTCVSSECCVLKRSNYNSCDYVEVSTWYFIKCHFKTHIFIKMSLQLLQTLSFLCGVYTCVSLECCVSKRSSYNSCRCPEFSPCYFFKCHFKTDIFIKVFSQLFQTA